MRQSIELLALQYPGRQDRLSERCIDDIDELVAAIIEQLGPWLDVPIALFGHSMGATVAYEVARSLEHQHGVVPLVLFASGQRAPSRRHNDQVHLGGDRRIVHEAIRLDRSLARFLRDDDLLQMVLPALRGDFRAIERYAWRPGPSLQTPIRAFLGDADPKVTPEDAAAWGEHTSSTFELKLYAGGHFFLRDHQASIIHEIAATALAVPRPE